MRPLQTSQLEVGVPISSGGAHELEVSNAVRGVKLRAGECLHETVTQVVVTVEDDREGGDDHARDKVPDHAHTQKQWRRLICNS